VRGDEAGDWRSHLHMFGGREEGLGPVPLLTRTAEGRCLAFRRESVPCAMPTNNVREDVTVPDTERMVLRRASWPDIDDVWALAADAEVMGYHGDGEPLTAARVLAVEMPRLMADSSRADQLGCWVARDRANGAFLGWFTLTPLDDAAHTVGLAYRLRRHALGRGYGIEGALQLIEMARAAHVSTVIAMTSADDVESCGVMEEAGLHLIGEQVRDSTTPAPAVERRKIGYRLDLRVDGSLIELAEHKDPAGQLGGA
jgi:RimJ/RimL family protein N-acetyltransferase